MQILRRFTRFEIQDAAIWKIAELMAYAMFLNLFLLGAEVFKEYYSNTEHLIHMQYMFIGVDGHTAIVPYMWLSVVCSIVAFVLFLIPRTRTQLAHAEPRLRADLRWASTSRRAWAWSSRA